VIALTKAKVLGYLTAIFAAGVLAGGVGGYTLARPKAGKPPPPPEPKEMAKHTIDRLEARLKLTPGQVGKIRNIVEQSFAEAHYRSGIHFKEVGEVFRKMNAQITEQLNSDQKEEFDRMEKERRDKMRGWGRPPKPQPPPSSTSELKDGTNCPSPGERAR